MSLTLIKEGEGFEDVNFAQGRKVNLPSPGIYPIVELDEVDHSQLATDQSLTGEGQEENRHTDSLPNLSDLLLPMESSGRPPEDNAQNGCSDLTSPRSDTTLEDIEREDSPYDRLLPLADQLRSKYQQNTSTFVDNSSLHLSASTTSSHLSPPATSSHLSPSATSSHLSPPTTSSHLSPPTTSSHLSPLTISSHLSPHTSHQSTLANTLLVSSSTRHPPEHQKYHHSHPPSVPGFTSESSYPPTTVSTTFHGVQTREGTVAQRVAQFSQVSLSDHQISEPTLHRGDTVTSNTNWNAKFHEFDLSQGSQVIDEDYYANHQRYHLHTYQGVDCSPSTKHSWEESTSLGTQSLPTNTHNNCQEQNGYLSDEGLSMTSSMEELTLINKEAQKWTGSSQVNVVKPLPINKEMMNKGSHLNPQHKHSNSQPAELSWSEGNRGNPGYHPRSEMSLSQPWGGGTYDHYGYTLSQPVSHQGLSLGYISTSNRHHNMRSNRTGDTKALLDAASSGDHLLLRRLLSGSHPHLTPTVRDGLNSTPIHKAAQNGHLHCLRYLIRNAPPDAVHLWDNDCNTPTLLAIQNGHLECVKWLVEEGGVPMVVPNSGGETLLHYSAFHGQAKILEWLLDKIRQSDDMDVDDVMDESGITPGHFAAYYGHLECLQLLWGQGVNLLMKDKFNHTPVDWARSARQTLCINYLTTVETCLNLMEENSELQQQVFDLQVSNQQLLEDIHSNNAVHQKEMDRLHQDFESRLENFKQAMPHSGFRHQRRTRQQDAFKTNNKTQQQQKVERHSLEDIEGQKERAKEELKMRRMRLRKKLQESSEQRGPEDVLAVMRAMSPLSPMLRREQQKVVSAPHSTQRRDSKDNSKSVTFADQVAKAALLNKHSNSAIEIDIDAAINKKDQLPTNRGYKEVNIDKAMEDTTLSLEVNIDEAIQKRGPKSHKGIMKRH